MMPLTCWLQSLDNFNRLAPAIDREDLDDLIWPGSNRFSSKSHPENPVDVPIVRKADLENHNKDGGHWIVVKVHFWKLSLWRMGKGSAY
jgi:E3 ubiquitin-protein ligase HERC2